MKIGMMNDPRLDVEQELDFAARHQFDFIDFTMEQPAADPGDLDLPRIRRILRDTGLDIIGHTPFYLPFDSLYQGMRKAAAREILRCMDAFSVGRHGCLLYRPGIYVLRGWNIRGYTSL